MFMHSHDLADIESMRATIRVGVAGEPRRSLEKSGFSFGAEFFNTLGPPSGSKRGRLLTIILPAPALLLWAMHVLEPARG